MSGNSDSTTPKVLVAPLDWGLGHATRCIPLVHALLAKNMQVTLAGEGACEGLLKLEFPELPFLHLPGYRVEYGRNRLEMMGKMLWQIPRLLECIDEEQEWLNGIMETEKFDIIFADNRYGLFHPDAYSVFIGHQLLIKTSLGALADGFLQPFQLDLINKFNECWVPDLPGEVNLAGDLSHPDNLPRIPVSYIGPLSRLQKQQGAEEHLLVLLSGPEPQRSIFEQLLLEQLEGYSGKVFFVRGLPGETALPEEKTDIEFVNHLPAKQLNEAISKASVVIARCGYSTVMDLITMEKKSVLIPTPGQTEQEYLAEHLMQYGMALCFSQEELNLRAALPLTREFNYYFPPVDQGELLNAAIDSLQQKLMQAPV
jgi:hypothetical protein